MTSKRKLYKTLKTPMRFTIDGVIVLQTTLGTLALLQEAYGENAIPLEHPVLNKR